MAGAHLDALHLLKKVAPDEPNLVLHLCSQAGWNTCCSAFRLKVLLSLKQMQATAGGSLAWLSAAAGNSRSSSDLKQSQSSTLRQGLLAAQLPSTLMQAALRRPHPVHSRIVAQHGHAPHIDFHRDHTRAVQRKLRGTRSEQGRRE